MIGESSTVWLSRAEPVFCTSLSLKLWEPLVVCVLCYKYLMKDRRITIGTQALVNLRPYYLMHYMLKKYFDPVVILLPMTQTHTHTTNGVGYTIISFFFYIPHYIPRVKLESKQLRKTDRKICSNN